MAIFHGTSIPAGASGGTAYGAEHGSIRLNRADSAYLTRTPASETNRQKYTLSFWMKRSGFTSGGHQYLFSTANTNGGQIYITNSDERIGTQNHNHGTDWRTSERKLRDISHWYHIVVAFDSTLANADHRIRMYINGVENTDWTGSANPSQNSNSAINCVTEHMIGNIHGQSRYFDGYLAQYYFIDGQQLTPDAFGEMDEDWGYWKPIEYTGTYGTNGYYLPFSNSGTKHTVTGSGDVKHSTTEKKIGASSMKFDGSGDYLTIPDHTDFDFDGNYTIEFWFNVNHSTQCCMYSHHASSVGHALFINGNVGQIYWQDNSNSISVHVGSGLNDGNWHHVAIVRNGSGSNNQKMYIDGTAESTQTGSSATTQSSDVAFGQFINGSSNYFNGYLDEIRISNNARYTADFTPSTTAFTADSNTKLLIQSDGISNTNVTSDSSKWSGNTSSYTYTGDDLVQNGGDKATWLGQTFSGDFEVTFTKTGSSNDFMCGLNLVSDEPGVLTDTIIKWETQGTSWFTKDNHSLKVGGSVVLNPGAPMIGEGDTCKWTRSNGVISFIKNGATLHTFTQQSTAPVRFGINGGGGFNGNGFSDISWTFDNTYTFTDSSGVAGGLGNDASGNGNHWTLNNITTSDHVLDCPSNNFAVMNIVNESAFNKGTFSEGNLKYVGHASGWHQGSKVGSMYTNDKLYFEWYAIAGTSDWFVFGGAPNTYSPSSVPTNNANEDFPGKTYGGRTNHGVTVKLNTNTNHYDGGSTSTAGQSAIAPGEVIMVAFDPATGKFWWGRDGSWESSGNPATGANPIATLSNLSVDGVTHTWTGHVSAYDNTHSFVINFGQDGTFAGNVTAGGNSDSESIGNFKYVVPSGFKALCSANLPDPAIKPTENFSVTIRSGNDNQAVTGIGLQPDLIWSKTRNAGQSHQWHDSVRGATDGMLSTGGHAAKDTTSTLDSFDSDGFTIDSGNMAGMNASGNNYVTWASKAGGVPTADNSGGVGGTPTAGSVKIDGANLGSALAGSLAAKRQSANTSNGFSITWYDGTAGEVKTVAHGLSKAPELVTIKKLNTSGEGWQTGSIQSLGSMDFTDALYLHDTIAISDATNWWNDTAPTSTVVTLGGNSWNNYGSSDFIMYCWHSVEGYSKIGSYAANYQTDGTFFYTGFRPAFVMTKRMDSAGWWVLFDTARSSYNPCDHLLAANVNNAENGPGSDTMKADILSNGFKLREQDSYSNASGGQYIYMAFAEQPFKYTTAR